MKTHFNVSRQQFIGILRSTSFFLMMVCIEQLELIKLLTTTIYYIVGIIREDYRQKMLEYKTCRR